MECAMGLKTDDGFNVALDLAAYSGLAGQIDTGKRLSVKTLPAIGDEVEMELQRLIAAARAGHAAGMQVNAGHGINYTNLVRLLAVPHLAELNIGHSIIARSTRIGLTAAVREMKELMKGYSL